MDFYVYLYSNSDNKLHNHTNQIFHFHTELNTPIELHGDWEVSLVELSYPKIHKVDSLFFFIYSDIVDYTHIGSHQFQILRAVQLQNSNPDYIVNVDYFTNPYYIKVTKSILNSIEIILESDLDLDPNHYTLSCGDVGLVLHFRPRK